MRRLHVIGLYAFALALAVQVRGEDDGSFKTTLSAGITLTDGNTESLQSHAALVAEGEREKLGSVRLVLEGFPVVMLLWPFVAWFLGLLSGTAMIVFYVLAAISVRLLERAGESRGY